MKVSVGFPVVKLDCHGVMSFLINGPYEASEVQAQISPVAAPRSTARLKSSMCFYLQASSAALAGWKVNVVDSSTALSMSIHFLGVTGAIIIFDEAIHIRHAIAPKNVVQRVRSSLSNGT